MRTSSRQASDYSSDEIVQFRRDFRPVAVVYRRHRRAGDVCFLLAMGFLLAGGFFSFVFHQNFMPGFAIPFLLCLGVWFWILMTTPKLVCPGCSKDMEHSKGEYCPECGSKSLEAPGLFRVAHCKACGKSMHGRRYKIRACTHCGLMLDDQGL